MMNLSGDQQLGALALACGTFIIVVITACITYYNVRYDNMVERAMAAGISPAVMECVDGSWDTVGRHSVCSRVLDNHKLTKEQAEKLMESLR